jgi:hypothetical protein
MRPTITAAGTLLASLALLVGCSPDKPPTPSTTGAPVSPPTDTPAADPPVDVAFPDLSSSSYAESIDQFAVTEVPRVQGFSFAMPDGLICGSNAYPEPQFESVSCRGPIPAQGPGDWTVTAEAGKTATIESITGDPGLAADRQKAPAVLPPMHKVTVTEKGIAQCGVDDEGTVACRIGQNGFVLTPSSVELF